MTQNNTALEVSSNEKMKQPLYDMVIVGGGISGLSMAHFCAKQGWSVLLLESSEHLGGALHSQHFNAPAQDFWVELGAHSCFNSYQHLIGILEDLELLEHIQKKQTSKFRLWRQGELLSIPSQLSILPLLLTLPKLFFAKKTQRTVIDYYTGLFGKDNYQNLFKHAFNAVICQPADRFPAELLFRKKQRRKEVLKSFTFKNGLQTITTAMSEQAGIDIKTGVEVLDVNFSKPYFEIKTNQSAPDVSFRSRYLTVATSVNQACTMLKHIVPQAAALLNTMQVVKVESVGVLVEKSALDLEQLAGIIAPDNAFYSLVSRDTVEHDTYRGFTVHFKPQGMSKLDKSQKICEVLGVHPQAIMQWTEKTNYLPALRLEHQEKLQQLDEDLKDLPLAMTGNYFNGVSIEDCITRSAVEFQRLCELDSVA